MATIGENIKRLRTKQGISQDDLARKAELKYSTLAKIEGDFVTKPGVQMVAKIAKALGVSVEDLLSDIKRVAFELKLDSLSVEEYDKNGKYHPSTLQRKFGSWTKTLKLAGLQIRKNPKIEAGELINDLKRVASTLNKKSVTQNEYKSLGKYDSAPLVRTFGSWFKALEKAGLEKTRTLGVTNE